ncbi:hypothetical+protein [Methylocapsa aurea]
MPASTKRAPWEILALLRLFLAWVVLSGHLTWYPDASGGWVETFDDFSGKAAVIGFLLVSGFSMSASLERDEKGFYLRRLLRIYPLYLGAVLMSLLIEAATRGHVQIGAFSIDGETSSAAFAHLFFLQGFLVKPLQFDGPLWSLAIEVFYYALAPFFRRAEPRLLLALMSLSLLCYFLPRRGDAGLVYHAVVKSNALDYLWCWLLGFRLWRDRTLPTLAFAGLGAAAARFGPYTPEPFAVVTYLLTLAALLLGDRIAFPHRLRRLATDLGAFSYPLYLFHFPAMIMGYAIFGLETPEALLAVALATTVLAFAFDRAWERCRRLLLAGSAPGARYVPVSATGVHSTCSIRSAPLASMTSRSKPSATPLAGGIWASAARKSSSIG